MHMLYVITSGSLLAYYLAAWVLGKTLGLTGSELYILWGLLAAIGTLGAGAFVWWKMRSKANTEGEEPEMAESASDGEVDVLIREAEEKLAASRLAQGSKIGNLPLLFVLGEQGSTKTTILVNSGLNPELLAGQLYQDNLIAPTRTANLWFANGTIFTELSPKVTSDSTTWTRVIRRLRPRTLKSVVGGNAQAPRAAFVCVNAEVFTQPGAADTLASLSRSYQAQLGELSQTLGISFPVYVLFTRCDRLPFFADYVRTLTNEEVGQPLGVTLPIRTGAAGVYAEEENQRLSNAFNQLFHSLSDHRVEFLPRETDVTKTPGAYEFPREFRKMRGPLVQFLIDVCRPSQLRTSPFLRGFYFCGVRPVTVQEAPVPTAPAPAPRPESAGSATGVFRVPTGAAPQPASVQPQYIGTKRVPQWLFLTRLFNQVILQDRVALSTSGASTRTSMAQRILLGAAALLFLAIATGFTVSFFKNRAIVNEAVAASSGFPAAVDASGPSVPDLQRLARLRGVLGQLTDYKTNGRPFSMGWGLYAGDDLYPAVRSAYYKRFAQLLFGHGQGALKAHMDALPRTPGANDDYGTSYEVLKGYLITTSHSNRASAESPAPILLRKWSETRNIQDQRKDLALAEFQFYASDLKNGNPYSTIADTNSVEHARDYLNQFSGIERVYQFMLSSAKKKVVNYNRDVPGSAQAVINNRDIDGAFTKAGYDFMQDALKKADKYFGGDQWVLERTRKDNVDTNKLAAELSARYVKDFIAQWRNYFKNTTVLQYKDLADAAQKLNLQTGTQSPILGVFWLAAQNTGVDYSKIQGADAIRKAFQPVHRVVPPGNAERYSAPTNKSYTDGLLNLQQSVDAAKSVPTPDGTAIIGAASTAKLAVKQMALEFDIDAEAKLNATVQKLLEDPIISAEELVKSLGPRELNGKGKAFCDTFDVVLRKLPFNPSGTAEASLQEVNALLKPGEGALWQFYQANLQKGLVKVGSDYRPNGELPLTPAFVTFFNNAARLSEAFYKAGPEPRLSYTVRALQGGLSGLTLVLDGQQLEAASGQTKQFTSPGSTPASYFAGKVSGNDLQSVTTSTGIWSAFKLLNDANRAEPSGTGYNLEWDLQTQVTFGRAKVSGAGATPARFFVDLGGANILLKRAGGLNCVRQVAK